MSSRPSTDQTRYIVTRSFCSTQPDVVSNLTTSPAPGFSSKNPPGTAYLTILVWTVGTKPLRINLYCTIPQAGHQAVLHIVAHHLSGGGKRSCLFVSAPDSTTLPSSGPGEGRKKEYGMLTRHGLPASIPTIMGATAAAAAGISYLDARLSLWSDVNQLLSRRVIFAEVAKAGMTVDHPPPLLNHGEDHVRGS